MNKKNININIKITTFKGIPPFGQKPNYFLFFFKASLKGTKLGNQQKCQPNRSMHVCARAQKRAYVAFDSDKN
jgi:hypothetical protein